MLNHLLCLFTLSFLLLNSAAYSMTKVQWIKKCAFGSSNTKQTCQQLKSATNIKKYSDLYHHLSITESLDLNLNNYSDLDIITPFIQIKKLSINANKHLLNLMPLAKLKNLEELYIFESENSSHEFVFVNKLTKLKKLILPKNNIEDVNFIDSLPNLSHLNLSQNRIAKFEVLKPLKSLKFLNLSKNLLIDIDFLSPMSDLRSLILNNNEIIDIAPIPLLSKLNYLNLSYNSQIQDFTPLEKLVNLNQLFLSHADLENIDWVNGLKALRTLDLSSNNINDLSALQHLLLMERLDIKNNQAADISPIRKLQNLRSLNIYNNSIEDLRYLSSLVDLKYLNIGCNGSLNDWSFVTKISYLEEIEFSAGSISTDYLESIGFKRDHTHKIQSSQTVKYRRKHTNQDSDEPSDSTSNMFEPVYLDPFTSYQTSYQKIWLYDKSDGMLNFGKKGFLNILELSDMFVHPPWNCLDCCIPNKLAPFFNFYGSQYYPDIFKEIIVHNINKKGVQLGPNNPKNILASLLTVHALLKALSHHELNDINSFIQEFAYIFSEGNTIENNLFISDFTAYEKNSLFFQMNDKITKAILEATSDKELLSNLVTPAYLIFDRSLSSAHDELKDSFEVLMDSWSQQIKQGTNHIGPNKLINISKQELRNRLLTCFFYYYEESWELAYIQAMKGINQYLKSETCDIDWAPLYQALDIIIATKTN